MVSDKNVFKMYMVTKHWEHPELLFTDVHLSKIISIKYDHYTKYVSKSWTESLYSHFFPKKQVIR
jgi:hypothetical protein